MRKQTARKGRIRYLELLSHVNNLMSNRDKLKLANQKIELQGSKDLHGKILVVVLVDVKSSSNLREFVSSISFDILQICFCLSNDYFVQSLENKPTINRHFHP